MTDKQKILDHINNVIKGQTFTTAVIRKKFPAIKTATANNAITQLAREGVIKHVRTTGKSKVYVKAGVTEAHPRRGDLQKVLREEKKHLEGQRDAYMKGIDRCDKQLNAIEAVLKAF